MCVLGALGCCTSLEGFDIHSFSYGRTLFWFSLEFSKKCVGICFYDAVIRNLEVVIVKLWNPKCRHPYSVGALGW